MKVTYHVSKAHCAYTSWTGRTHLGRRKEQQIMRKPETSDLIIGTGVAILVLLIGTLIDKSLDLLGFQAVAIGAAIAIVIILGIIAIVWFLGRRGSEVELQKAIENLRSMAPSSRYEWLYTPAEMDEIEEKTKYKNIWIVSYDLSNDTGNPDTPIISILKKNLKRGINYTYIIPDIEHTNAVLPHLYQIFSSYSNQLRIIPLPQSTFDFFTTTHIAIYNPNMEGGQLPQVFIELPIQERGYSKGYWVRVADDISLKVVGRFRNTIDNARLLQPSDKLSN